MKNKILLFVAASVFFLSPTLSFAQVITLGTSAKFVLFTKTGAVGNTAISQLTGDVGSNNGNLTGFGNVNGNMQNANGATASAAADLQTAYSQLNSTIPTNTHAPLLGNGETLVAGVYDISGQTTLSNTLILDAQNNPNAVFIFKISAVFNTTASSVVSIINGGFACKVFWKVEGAVNLGSLSTMKGTIVANNGAIDIASGVSLEGRALSTTGAVTVNSVTAKAPIGCGSPILTGPLAPNLASVACYTLFSRNGEVTNSAGGVTTVKGDIGTNVGLTTGFNPLLTDGSIHSIPDNSTATASADLLNVRTHLQGLTPDIELLYPADFGKGLVLTPHTYVLNGGTSFIDTLFLNSEGNADAVFVIKIYGAFSTGSFATVKLINGTQAKNVFWLIGGALSVGNKSTLKGTFVCHNGAIDLQNGTNLEGRAMTTDGALLTTSLTAAMTAGCTTLPLTLTSFTGMLQNNAVTLLWKTANEQNAARFEVEQSLDGSTYQTIGTVSAAGTSSTTRNYSFMDRHIQSRNAPVVYYRLKSIDLDARFTYSGIVAIQIKSRSIGMSFYPNPVKETAKLTVTLLDRESINYSIVDNMGKVVRIEQANLPAGSSIISINVKNLVAGSYNIRIEGPQSRTSVPFIKQ